MKHINVLTGLLLLAMVFTGCTEDRQEQTLLKPADQIMPKSNIDQLSNYLYVPLGQEASRSSLYGRAFNVGQTKVVKVQINEFTMDVVSIEKDDRFGDNPNNEKTIISIPIKHVDFRCQDDAFGECVGSEVENERITWDKKKFIRPNFAEAKIIDTNFFASELDSINQCYELQETELVKRTITSDTMNFTLKRKYQDNLFRFFCSRNVDTSDLTNLNWTETTSYSLVKLDTVASKDYKAAVYHPDWINTFGIFEVNDFKLDVDGNATQNKEIKYMQRWNPKRTEVVYHLSESFNKPKNKVLKAATYESFKRLNQGLATAGAKFRLKLEEPRDDIDPGDLRNTMLILVDDPLASSVIGYGPSIANPLTGEVISARTMMYAGSVRKFVRFSYDDMVREFQQQQIDAAAPVSEENQDAKTVISGALTNGLQENLVQANLSKKQINSMLDLSNIVDIDVIEQIDRTPNLSNSEIQNFMDNEAKRDFIAILAKQNKYPAEALEFGDINQDLVKEVVASIGELKPWETLSNQQKQNVLDVLTPYVWVPTLVHEIGHNLGLRHNFSGSEDAVNYYSNDELAALNVPTSTTNAPYSSVMDYPKSETNALRTLGKYDVAALRFAYADTVALEDGSEVKVDSSTVATAGLKAYNYCSDDGVAPNPTCNAFDEGVGLKQIAESLIDSYKNRYKRSNFRRGRANFSGISDDLYLRGINRTFNTLRLIYERYESLVSDFQLDQETIDSVPFLKEIDESVVIAADFMMEVIATPDTTCVILDTETNSLQVAPIGIFSSLAHDRTRSCANLQLNPQFQPVGEGGKPLNSLKLPTNPNRFADQIDVRGIWMDKALAMTTLFKRTLGSSLFDKTNGNFLDHPKAGPKVMQFVQRLMTNQLTTPVDITFNDGSTQNVELAVNMDEDFYKALAPDISLPNRMLGIPYKNMDLPGLLVSVMKNGIYEGEKSPANEAIKATMDVDTTHPNTTDNDRFITIDTSDQTLFAQKGTLAGFVMANAKRADFYEGTGLSTDSLSKVLSLLESPVDAEVLVDGEDAVVLENDPKEGLTPIEQQVFDRGAEDIKAYLANPTSAKYMKRILLSM